jgi:dihydroflavonol-4-reductase
VKALVTGATGFIGSSIARQLVEAGAEVRVLVRATSDTRNLDGVDVEHVQGDICDYDSVRSALAGCDTLFHAAAYFTHWNTDRQRFYDVNVGGTRNSMQAALDAGVEKVVYTSTNNAIGAYGATPVTEDADFNYWDTGDHYSISKYFAEVEVFKFGARGLPVVVVNPTLVVGPNDRRPTSSGQLIVELASAHLPAYVDGFVNVVDVDDVARGHLLAAQKGRVGERYLLSNENLTIGEYFRMVASAAGVRPPRVKAPYAVALAMAHGYELVSRITKRHPAASVSEVRIGRLGETYDNHKAVTELGFTTRPAAESVQRAVDWFAANGYLTRRAERATPRATEAITAGSTVHTRDGRELHIEPRGEGEPVVVFESGMGVSHHMWGAVMPLVAEHTKVVAYDRSGLGRSPSDSAPRTLERLTDDLLDVLDHLGPGPFVLVGHSWGGPVVRSAAAARPDLVVGLVLVDQTDEGCDLFFEKGNERQTKVMLSLLPLLGRVGVLRMPAKKFASMLPEPDASGMATYDGTLAAALAQQAELRPCDADLRRLRDHPLMLPDVPVTYLSGGTTSWLERGRRAEVVAAHRAAAAALPQGRHIVAPKSSHYIPFTEPELVASEVLRVVDQARGARVERVLSPKDDPLRDERSSKHQIR